MTTGRQTVGSAGIYTSALAAGGNTGSPSNKTESWNGTNWTEDGDLNTARYNLEGGGTTSSAVMAGGDTGSITGASEEWTGAGPVTRTFTDS